MPSQLTGSETFVETGEERRRAWVVHDRSRHKILRVEGGRYAKVVKRSADPASHVWTIRNRVVWRHLSRLPHPGLMRVYERVTDRDGDEGFLCEGLDDHPLGAGIHPAAMTLGGFLLTCERLAEAAGHMHEHGFVHGDITPGNVCFRRDGTPVLIDLDTSVRIGKGLRYPGERGGECVILTPACCSPEQAMGHPVYPQSDVYCLALTMLSWVSGAYGMVGPGTGGTDQLIALCRNGAYPHWSVIDRRLRHGPSLTVFAQALDPHQIDRFDNGAEFADRLRRVRTGLSKAAFSSVLPSDPLTPVTVRRDAETMTF